jgi:hypothetical protein
MCRKYKNRYRFFYLNYFFPVIGDILLVIIYTPKNCFVFLILLSNILKFFFLLSYFNSLEYIFYFIFLYFAKKP